MVLRIMVYIELSRDSKGWRLRGSKNLIIAHPKRRAMVRHWWSHHHLLEGRTCGAPDSNLTSQRTSELLLRYPKQTMALFTSPKMEESDSFLLLFTNSGGSTKLAQTARQIRLLLNSSSLGPVFRCSQIGRCSEIELKSDGCRRIAGNTIRCYYTLGLHKPRAQTTLSRAEPKITTWLFIKLSLF